MSTENKLRPLEVASFSMKNCVLKNFTKFTGKHLCQSVRLWHRCFPVNFVKILKTSFLQNTSG